MPNSARVAEAGSILASSLGDPIKTATFTYPSCSVHFWS
jgi:hypothetical protein